MARNRRALPRLLVALVAVVVLVVGILLLPVHRPEWSGSPIAADAATPPGTTLTLYDNAVSSSFNDGTYGASAKIPCDTSMYYSAPCSYAISYTAWGGLNFQVISGTLNTSGFTNLEYTLNPNGQPVSDFGAILIGATGSGIKEVPLSGDDVTSLTGGWVRVSIPLSALNPSGLPVIAVQLRNELNTDLQTVHYDDVMLTGGNGGTGLSTAVPTTPTPVPTVPPAKNLPLLPGQKMWVGGVSSYLFGSNDTEEWNSDNVETDPHNIIQPSMRAAGFTLERTFIFHYSLRDGHRTTIGRHPRMELVRGAHHEYDRPAPPPNLTTGTGYEVEKRIKTIERMGMHCLVSFPDIWTTPRYNDDPNPFHKRITDPNTGKPETDLDFARKVVAYLGNRCNLYEIGNEPDLDTYTENGSQIHHMDVKTYVERWTEFVRALRKINPKARFIGPVTYSYQGNDCGYTTGSPFPTSQPGDCYLQNFLHGVRGTNVEPDAVSFHLYACDNATVESCGTAQWSAYGQKISEVRSWITRDLGHPVRLGITEWNFDPGSNTELGRNATFMDAFSRAALQSMISARLDFAAQFDTASFSGYGALDMFDNNDNDRPKAQFQAVKEIIAQHAPAARKGKSTRRQA